MGKAGESKLEKSRRKEKDEAMCRHCPHLKPFWSFEDIELHSIYDHSELLYRCDHCANAFESSEAACAHQKKCDIRF